MAKIENVTVDSLRGLDVFAQLPDASLEWLLRASSLRSLSARERLSSSVSGASEQYCFVLQGAVAVVKESAGASTEATSNCEPPMASDIEYIGYFEAGACFSDGFFAAWAPTSGPRVDCIATTSTTLLQVETTRLASLMTTHVAWHSVLAQNISAARDHFLTQQDPSRRVVQDFFLRGNYSTSSLVRVGCLDRCLDCNKCHDACAARHGAARMVRSGPSLGRLTFPIVCRSCHDRPCLSVCSFGGITFDENSGDVRILDQCVGCGACMKECPNGAISMVQRSYTVADFPEPLPVSDGRGRTNIANLFVAGDVSGAGLIRIAMNEAVRAVDSIGPRRSPPGAQVADVAIVGAGPAGLAAALRCRERGLSCVILEKDRLASTIQDYPKNKHVMAEPSAVPLLSSLWFQDCTKEELLARWRQTVIEQQVPVFEGAEINTIENRGGFFRLSCTQGELVAENVVVCIGKRGSPRKLGVEGEVFPRVRYVLSDAEELAGQNVLVVGGGDSAVEAALSLADTPGTRVWLSYRQAAFTRTKPLNRQRLESYKAQGRICVMLKSTVSALEIGAVRINTELGEQRIANDVVLALLGADPPTAFLQHAGIRVLQPRSPEMADYALTRGKRQQAVKCDHCAGFPDKACLSACPTGALMEMQTDELFMEAEEDPLSRVRKFSDAPFLNGVKVSVRHGKSLHAAYTFSVVLLLLSLMGVGLESFLRRTLPELSLTAYYARYTHQDLAISFSSGRGFGHWLGYIGASLMLASLLYSLRTRIKRLRRFGAQSTWLTAHLWLGFTGAMLVTYHSALKMDRWASIACVLMWIVVVTGTVGRYLFGRVHSAMGLAEFELSALREKRSSIAHHSQRSRAIRVLIGADALGGAGRALLVVVLWHELRDRAVLAWLRLFGARSLAKRQDRRELVRTVAQWAAARRRGTYYQLTKSTLRHWNIVHITLAILMFVLAGIHIVYGFMYKAV